MASSPGGQAVRGEVGADHELLRNLLLHANLSGRWFEFEGVQRDDVGVLFQFGIPLKQIEDGRVICQRQRTTPGNHPLGNTQPGICFPRGLRRKRRLWKANEQKWTNED